MTISSEISRVDYVGNGATSVYPYTFKILDESNLLVVTADTAGVETTLSNPTDYTVSGVGSASGGNVTLTAGNLTSGYTITIRRVLSLVQEADIRNQGAFYREIHEDVFDRQTMVDQQQQDAINRTIRLPETEVVTAANTVLPSATVRASKVFGFDSSGNPTTFTSIPTGAVTVSSFAETFLDDANATTVRTTIGASRSARLDVKDYGAIGDGATDDTGAIQSVFTLAQGMGGATIFFPSGIYKISSEITYTGSAIDVWGEAPDRSVLKADNATQNMFHFSTGGNGSIHQLGFSYSTVKTAGAAIYFDTWGSSEIANVAINGHDVGIRFENANFVKVKDTLIQNTIPTTGYGITIHGGIEQTLERVTCNGGSGTQPAAGLKVTKTSGLWLRSTEFNHCGIGWLFEPSGTDAVENIHTSANVIDSCTGGAGVKINPGVSARVSFMKSVNDWFTSNGTASGGYGLLLDGGGTVVDIRICNGMISNNGSHGIAIVAGTDIHMVGNSIIGNSQSSSGTYSGVAVGPGVSKFSIIGNKIGTVAGFAGTTQKYGVSVAAGSSNIYQIIGNNLTDNVTAGLSDLGTGTAKLVYGNLQDSVVGNIVGTATNDSVTAGYVGEIISGSQTSETNFPASGAYGDITSIALTPGDWDLEAGATAAFVAATIFEWRAGIGTAAGNSTAGLTSGTTQFYGPAPVSGAKTSISIPRVRVSISASATYYLKIYSGYSGTAPTYTGSITARRVR